MVNLPGAMPEIFRFTVRDDRGRPSGGAAGRPARPLDLRAAQGPSRPRFGDTEYFIVRISSVADQGNAFPIDIGLSPTTLVRV